MFINAHTHFCFDLAAGQRQSTPSHNNGYYTSRDAYSPAASQIDGDYKYGRFDASALHIAHALKQTEVQKAYNKRREKPIDYYLVSVGGACALVRLAFFLLVLKSKKRMNDGETHVLTQLHNIHTHNLLSTHTLPAHALHADSLCMMCAMCWHAHSVPGTCSAFSMSV